MEEGCYGLETTKSEQPVLCLQSLSVSHDMRNNWQALLFPLLICSYSVGCLINGKVLLV